MKYYKSKDEHSIFTGIIVLLVISVALWIVIERIVDSKARGQAYGWGPPPGYWPGPRPPMPMGPPQGPHSNPRYYDDGGGMGTYRPVLPFQHRQMDPYIFRNSPPYNPRPPFGPPHAPIDPYIFRPPPGFY